VYIKDAQSSTTIQTLNSDSAGYFLANLKPGNYTVEIAKQGIANDKNGPHQITIIAGQTTTIEIMVDTGIR
jgi:hypothetical protein